jgi:hypothetical protein
MTGVVISKNDPVSFKEGDPELLCPCCRDEAERRRAETIAMTARLKAARDASRTREATT